MRKFIPLALLLAACATPQRKIASGNLVSPFGAVSHHSEVVDSVIARLGPVRSQANTQLCFAYAGADIATFHSGKRVSAFSVAIRNFQHRSGFDNVVLKPVGVIAGQASAASRYMIGLGSSTLKSSLRGTLCAEDQPDSALTYLDSNLKDLWVSYHEKYRPYFGPTAPVDLYREIEGHLAKIMPSLPAADFIEHISRYKPIDRALGEWFDRRCDIKIPGAANLSVMGKEIKLNSAAEIIASLDLSLESGEPAVIHYDPAVLESEETALWKTLVGTHVSTIVARAEKDGARHYLLRNSWGPRCDFYSSEIASRCDRGHIWLTESEIRKYVTSVAYYAKKR